MNANEALVILEDIAETKLTISKYYMGKNERVETAERLKKESDAINSVMALLTFGTIPENADRIREQLDNAIERNAKNIKKMDENFLFDDEEFEYFLEEKYTTERILNRLKVENTALEFARNVL